MYAFGELLELFVAVTRCAVHRADLPDMGKLGSPESLMAANTLEIRMCGFFERGGIDKERDRLSLLRHRQPLFAVTSQAFGVSLGRRPKREEEKCSHRQSHHAVTKRAEDQGVHFIGQAITIWISEQVYST
jgi:hypothetical protein